MDQKMFGEEKTVISIRVSKSLIAEFDNHSKEANISRNKLIEQAMMYFVENVEVED